METNIKRALSALGAVAFALTLSACPTPPECEVNGDCEGTEICSEDGTCEPDQRPIRCDNGLLTCATTEVCDEVDGACKTCTATAGCGAGAAICDTAANNGLGVCKTCLSDNTGCGSEAPICDVAAGGGLGACIVCNATVGCRASQGETCDIAANGGAGACVECLGDSECTEAGATICSAGTCQACRDSDQTALGLDEGCTAGTQICDTTGVAPVCRQPTCEEDADYCVGCVTNADCSVSEQCGAPTPASQCEPASIAPADASADIAEVHAAPTGAQATGISVAGVLVTYIKPAIGNEPAGFFVQAQATGPGLYVLVDPASLTPVPAVGDRVSFVVQHVLDDAPAENFSYMDTAKTITGFTVLSSGHPVQSLSSATPAGLKQDVSNEAALVGASAVLTAFESELITLSGTLAGPALPSGTGFVQLQMNTAGVPTDERLRVRFPLAVYNALHLFPGCQVTLNNGVYMRSFNDYANPGAYSAADVTVNSCPTPQIVRAAATGPLEVTVFFNRPLDPATVLATDFTIAGLTVAAATVSNERVILTTTAQTNGEPYTVALGDSVADTAGTANVASSSAPFVGRGALLPRLVINEVDYDQAVADDMEFIEIYNAGDADATLADAQVILLNLTASDRLYRTIALSGAVDSAGVAAPTLAPGGYLVISSNATILSGLPAAALRVTTAANGTTGWFQNGDPDGLVLWDNAAGAVLDTLSYEGDLLTNTIPYSGGTRADVAAREGSTSTRWIKDSNFGLGSVRRIPNGVDTNNNADDFQPQDEGGYPTEYSGAATPGAANTL